MENMEKDLLQTIADIRGFMPGSAFSLRKNGEGIERHSTAVSYTHLTLPTN